MFFYITVGLVFLRLQIIIYETFFNLKLKFTEQIKCWMNTSCFRRPSIDTYICVHFQVVGINLASAKLGNLKCIKQKLRREQCNECGVICSVSFFINIYLLSLPCLLWLKKLLKIFFHFKDESEPISRLKWESLSCIYFQRFSCHCPSLHRGKQVECLRETF